ncbi:hypothetical protein M9980_13950 [Sphingomonas donggukensis]|uniref:Uncharacterized protein n=1 Tax=Sphingomonas donggukensis TaxID=2949093 RepID=A0ABY4TWS3_9SPHN|nr:hypothetical protein [Sphingomonas donggukensis]URW75604.1 hypothetical protein M9980_13950 [Sphingomonas donggukensis]
MAAGETTPYPDGLGDSHAARAGWLGRHANLLSLVVLGTLMALALSGVLAGGRSAPRVAETAAATVAVTTPTTLRNGEFFEMRIRVAAKAPIAKLGLALPPGLWRDMTVNTVIPAASEESFKDGAFRFDYGALGAGEVLEVKVDGQINPPLTVGTQGDVTLYDGDRAIAAVPLSIRVLP